jgi:hypothetical protein
MAMALRGHASGGVEGLGVEEPRQVDAHYRPSAVHGPTHCVLWMTDVNVPRWTPSELLVWNKIETPTDPQRIWLVPLVSVKFVEVEAEAPPGLTVQPEADAGVAERTAATTASAAATREMNLRTMVGPPYRAARNRCLAGTFAGKAMPGRRPGRCCSSTGPGRFRAPAPQLPGHSSVTGRLLGRRAPAEQSVLVP